MDNVKSRLIAADDICLMSANAALLDDYTSTIIYVILTSSLGFACWSCHIL